VTRPDIGTFLSGNFLVESAPTKRKFILPLSPVGYGSKAGEELTQVALLVL